MVQGEVGTSILADGGDSAPAGGRDVRWKRAAVVSLLAALAGAAIAGLPDSVSSTRVVASPSFPPAAQAPVQSLPTTAAPTPSPAEAATTTTISPSSPVATRSAVRVIVVNAGGRSGLAAAGAERLAEAGYRFVITASAANEETSVVLFAPGMEREARRLAADLGLDASAALPWADQPIDGVNPVGADVVAVLAGEVDL